MPYHHTRRPTDLIFDPPNEVARSNRLESTTSAVTNNRQAKLTRTRVVQIALVVITVVAVVVSLGTHLATRRSNRERKLLIVSFDGLRWDYPLLFHPNMPIFRDFAEEGVSASLGIKPCFTTETFPNHFSIATGLYEESHGIVSNTMYDPTSNKSFSLSDSTWFQGGEPLWVTAKRQGLKSGVFFWFGSDHQIRGLRPNLYRSYNFSVDYYSRIDTIISWFVDDHINLGMLYFERPDWDGHMYGIDGDQFKSALRDVDGTLGYLLYKIDEAGLDSSMNLIIMSDHGMVNMHHKIIVEDYVNLTDIMDYESNSRALVNLFPRQGRLNRLYDALKDAHPNLTVYKKEDLPSRFHYKNNQRIAPLILIADEGYIILKSNSSQVPHQGYHGYDNDLPNMRAYFAARGPAFKQATSVNTFNNIDVYPLACRILDLNPAPNNGTIDTVRHLLLRP